MRDRRMHEYLVLVMVVHDGSHYFKKEVTNGRLEINYTLESQVWSDLSQPTRPWHTAKGIRADA